MAATNMNNLTTLIKRLEAATSRLEDMTQSTVDSVVTLNGMPFDPATTPKGLSVAAAAGRDGQGPPPPPPSLGPALSLPVSIKAFDDLINHDVAKFVKLGEDLGGVVAEQSAGVHRAFDAQRKIIFIASRAKKPDVQSPLYMEILTELQRQMGSVGDLRETNRTSSLANHLSTVSEGITALGWITIEPEPAEFIKGILGSAQFFGNRVLKEYKERDRTHVEWIQAFYQIFKSLARYVKQYHLNGLWWNRNGTDARELLQQVKNGPGTTSSASTSASAPNGAMPPPPPPLPTLDNGPPAAAAAAAKGQPGGDMDSVFAQLNQGEAVTSGLRRVDKDDITHPNLSVRARTSLPNRTDSQTSTSSGRKSPAPPGKKPKPESMRTMKPARKELDGNRWVIENYESEPNTVHVAAEINQVILISRCRDTTVQITGKANAVSVDNSPRLSLIVDSLVSSVNVIKSSTFALQVLGALPTMMLDQVDGATIYLSPLSLSTEVFTSKCSSVNVNIPSTSPSTYSSTDDDDDNGADDYVECSVPEQIKSFIRHGKLVNEIVEHAA